MYKFYTTGAKLFAIAILLSSIFSRTANAQLESGESATSTAVLISELQSSEDVIELTNTSEDTIDVSEWIIQSKSTGATSNWIQRFIFPEDTFLYPGGALLITHSGYLEDQTIYHMAFDMAADRGHVRILDNSSERVEVDKLAWGIEALDAETLSAPKPTLGLSLQRKMADEKFVDTNNNSIDFELATPTFSSRNIAPEVIEEPDPETPEPPIEESPQEEEAPVDEEESPAVEEIEEVPPTPELTLLNPLVTEFLPDPEAPLTDADDEWIEIFNPNNSELNLNGFILKSGNSYSYSYTFGDVLLPPLSYTTYKSVETNLTLSNSGGAVRLIDPNGEIASDIVYTEAKTAWSYMLEQATNAWLWTTTPTPDAVNLYTLPAVPTPAQKVVKAASAKVTKATTAKAATVKKATAVKKATTKKTTDETRSVFVEPASVDVRPPIHPVLLAIAASLAVLYGGYEYRSELRNFFARASNYIRSRQ